MLIQILDYTIFYAILIELIIYIMKFWNFDIFSKNNTYAKIIYDSGIKINSSIMLINKSEAEIISFVRTNIKPFKIINSKIYLRRKYLKWIQWATPVPIQGTIWLNQSGGKSVLNLVIRTIYTPWLILAYYGLIRRIILSEPIDSILIVALFSFLIFIGLAQLEKFALISKIKKISELDDSYNYFA